MRRLRSIITGSLTLLSLMLSIQAALAQDATPAAFPEPEALLQQQIPDPVLQQRVRDGLNQYGPIGRREANAILQLQDQTQLSKHPSIIQDMPAEYRTAASAAPTHAAAPEQAAAATDTPATADSIPTDQTTGAAADDPALRRQVRLLERIDKLQGANQYALHPAADESHFPLIPTGPATTLTLLVMMGAVGWTLWRARKLEY